MYAYTVAKHTLEMRPGQGCLPTCSCFTFFVCPAPSEGVGALSLRRKGPGQETSARKGRYLHTALTINTGVALTTTASFHAPVPLEKYVGVAPPRESSTNFSYPGEVMVKHRWDGGRRRGGKLARPK